MKSAIRWGILVAVGVTARAAMAQSVTQISTLTSTTTGEVLHLTASVTPVPGTTRFDWRYQLLNPAGNRVRINSFTAQPRVNLTELTVTASPTSWAPAVIATGDAARVVWNWLPDNPSQPTNLAAQLDPGETFLFAFQLGRGALPNAGHAAANNSHGFSGVTVGGGLGGPGTPVAVVPEPATMLLLAAGLGLAALWGRRGEGVKG